MEIFIGQQAHLTLSVQAKKGQRVELPLFKESEYMTPGVEVLDNGEEQTNELDNNTIETIRQYTLTSFDDTLYYIPALKVKVDGKDYEGKSLALKVLTCEVDTLHPEQFAPPKDVQDPPFMMSEWTSLGILSLIALLLLLLAVYFYQRLKAGKPLNLHFSFRKKLSPYELAVKEINALKDRGTAHSEDQKGYYSQLTDTLRNYLDARFGINAKEMITSEIIQALESQDKALMLSQLRQLFETADLVKFAKYEAPLNENDLNLANALQFVTTTKPEEKPDEKTKKTKRNEAEKQMILWRRIYRILIASLTIAASILIVYVGWQLLNLI